jgi:YVTN family beta-propeller protein
VVKYRKIVLSLLRGGVVVVAVAVVCSTAGAAEPAKVHVGLSASFALSGGGALWVTDRVGNKLIRVDPAAGRVKWQVGIPSSPFGLAYGAGSVWVGSRNGGRVTRVNPSTKRIQKRIPVGAAPYALAFGAGAVWVSNESSHTVSRISPKRNRVVKTIRVGGEPNGIAVAFGKIWVADYGASHLIRIDPVHNRVEKRISLPKADWITPSADALWVSSETGVIYKIDPATMAVETTVTVGANPLATTWVGGRLWVPNIDDNSVSVVDPATGSVVSTTPSGQSPLAVASAAGYAWVTSDFDGDLWRFDP